MKRHFICYHNMNPLDKVLNTLKIFNLTDILACFQSQEAQIADFISSRWQVLAI